MRTWDVRRKWTFAGQEWATAAPLSSNIRSEVVSDPYRVYLFVAVSDPKSMSNVVVPFVAMARVLPEVVPTQSVTVKLEEAITEPGVVAVDEFPGSF